ncbi:SigE family RNA polymerase sigma factor [Actinokineospora sp.]|uniref:SigE family RNA polymerase sigma factor n=1 Tax=Actinokineospora sp. TaxID=1872133 RepID=UPI004037DF5B
MDGEERFRQFVAARQAALLRTACLLSGDWAAAEDLLQTALTKTYLAWGRIRDHEAAEAYVRRTMVHTSTSWWRRRWRGERPTAVLPEIVQPDFADTTVERQALWAEVLRLPPRQRAVIVLRFHDDLSEAATAAILGVTVGTVKSQSSRALSALRRQIARTTPSATTTPGSVTR